jgi:hypothetical protein
VKPFESLAEVQAAARRALETKTCRLSADSLVEELEVKARTHEKRARELTRTLEQTHLEIKHLASRLARSKAVSTRHVEQIEGIIANVDKGILVTDIRGSVLSLNRELRVQLHAGNMSGTGISVDRLPGDGALRDAICLSRQIPHVDSGDPIPVESSDAQGRQCTYEVSSTRVFGADDEVVGIVTTVRESKPKAVRV